MAKNLFDKAKTTPKAKAKKDDKETVMVVDAEFDSNLKKFAELKPMLDNLTAQMEVAKAAVKEVCITEYKKLYSTLKRNPGSFIVSTLDGANVMLVPSDKYITIDEDRSEELKETYGENIVKETTDYAFNSALLEKYMEVLSDMIMNSDKIAETDKENLIVASTKYSVKSGSIDEVFNISSDTKTEVSSIIEDLQPVFSVKNPKLV